MNTGRVGFFRVNYSDDLLRRLLPHVQSSMAPADRLGLISDVIALSAAGIANVSSVMLLLSSYGAERELSVLQEIRDGLSSLMRIHSSSNKIKSYLQSIICKIFVPI